MVHLDVEDGQEDQQPELPGAGHALGAVEGAEPNRGFHPLAVQCCFRRQSCCRNISAQSLDNAPGHDGPGTSEHDGEHLAALIVAGLKVREAINSLQCPPVSPPSACPPASEKARHLGTAAASFRGIVLRAS
jgi:hypothetical protein